MNRREFVMGTITIGSGLAQIAQYLSSTEYFAPNVLPMKEALRTIIGIEPLSVYEGDGNINFVSDGKPTVSRYSKSSTAKFHTAIRNSYKDDFEFKDINETPIVDLDFSKQSSGLYLGGPMANSHTAAILGYSLDGNIKDTVTGFVIPQVKDGFNLPFQHHHGETAFGEFDGKKNTALRTRTNGDFKESPMSAIMDRRNNDSHRLLMCDKDIHGRLSREYLQILKIVQNGKTRMFLWGLHGMSSESFTSELHFEQNLIKLAEHTEGLKEFHALIPMEISYPKIIGSPDKYESNCVANWDAAKSNDWIVDLQSWRKV